MKVYTCNEFTGFNPVGVAAVIAASSAAAAAKKLNKELKAKGLPGDALPEDMILFHPGDKDVRILYDGNY